MKSPLRQSTRSRGQKFEKLAEEFLTRNGWLIRDRNWRAGHREIDLIAVKDQTIIFVEVKGARSKRFGHPGERVNRRKRGFLSEAAQQYIIEKNLTGYDFRFDLITFVNGELEYFPDAFQMESE